MKLGRLAILSLLVAALAPVAVMADGSRDLYDVGPSYGEPLRFRAANGGAFRPDRLILLTSAGAFAAPLPEAGTAVPESRLDFSGAPLVGTLFRPTLSPADARTGDLLGPVHRVGDALVLDARGWPSGLTNVPVALSTIVPVMGAVSFRLGRLGFAPVSGPAVPGSSIGEGYLVDGLLVVASRGGEPAYPDFGVRQRRAD